MFSKVSAEKTPVAAVPPASDQASIFGVKLNPFNVVSKSQKNDVGTQSKPHAPVSPVLTPGTPIVLSPSSSISSPPSPSPGSIVWDTPVTPLRQISKQGNFGLSTPLTPPSTSDNFWKTNELQSRPHSLTGKNRRLFTREPTPSTASDTTSRTLWPTTQVSDRVVSKKIFSDESVQSIPKKDTSLHGIRYSLKPSVCFTQPSNLRRSTASTTKQASEKRKPQVETEVKIEVKAEIEIEVKAEIETEIKTEIETEIELEVTETHPPVTYPTTPTEVYRGLQAILEHTIPSQVRARLQSAPEQCVATLVKTPWQTCSRTATGSGIHAEKILDDISRCIKHKSYAALPEHLEQLVDRVTCSQHRKSALQLLKQRSKKRPDISRLDELRDFIRSYRFASDNDRSIFSAWTNAIATEIPPASLLCSTQKDALMTASTKTQPTKASSPVPKIDLPNFLPYKSALVTDAKIAKDLEKAMKKNLTDYDLKHGHIYMFWDIGNFGMVKIGRTDNLDRRMNEWSKCKPTHSYHTSTHQASVAHVQRIERLIHIELINSRRKLPCNICPKAKMHKEWFNVTEQRAQQVSQKWHDWMLKEPYAEDAEGNWVLRPEMRDMIPELCKVTPEEKQTPVPSRRKGRGRKAKRPGLSRSDAWRELGTAFTEVALPGEHVVFGKQEAKELRTG